MQPLKGWKHPQTQEKLMTFPSFLIHRYISTTKKASTFKLNGGSWDKSAFDHEITHWRFIWGEIGFPDYVPAVGTFTDLGSMFRCHGSQPSNHRSQCRWSNVDIKLSCHTDCCLRSWKGLKKDVHTILTRQEQKAPFYPNYRSTDPQRRHVVKSCFILFYLCFSGVVKIELSRPLQTSFSISIQCMRWLPILGHAQKEPHALAHYIFEQLEKVVSLYIFSAGTNRERTLPLFTALLHKYRVGAPQASRSHWLGSCNCHLARCFQASPRSQLALEFAPGLSESALYFGGLFMVAVCEFSCFTQESRGQVLQVLRCLKRAADTEATTRLNWPVLGQK